MSLKLFLVLFLLFLAICYWILPKTELAKRFRITETFFYLTNIVGILSGATGLLLSFAWGEAILTKHYFELILLLPLCLYVYLGIIVRIQGRQDVYDEKQTYDMTRSASVSLFISWPAMIVLHAMFKESILEGLVWFPIYIYFTLMVFSTSTLILYRRD